MTAKGHVMLASVTTLGLFDLGLNFNISIPYPIYFYSSMIIGSLMPDIDEPHSYIGNKLKIFSVIISAFVKHRGFTHFLIVPLLIAIGSYFVINKGMQITLLGLAWGILLHDAGDMLTKGGVKGFFFPFSTTSKVTLDPEYLRFYTFSLQEYGFIVFLLFPLNLYFIYDLFEKGFFNEIF